MSVEMMYKNLRQYRWRSQQMAEEIVRDNNDITRIMHGCMDTWIRGCMDTWIRGCMDTRMHGCMDAWMHGCMDAWIHGCMDTWMHGYTDAWIGDLNKINNADII